MGAAGSVLQLQEESDSINKERCQEVTGEAFTEELWQEHSVEGVISKEKLLELSQTLSSSSDTTPDVVIVVEDDASYQGGRNEQGQKHGQGKFTYANGVCVSVYYEHVSVYANMNFCLTLCHNEPH